MKRILFILLCAIVLLTLIFLAYSLLSGDTETTEDVAPDIEAHYVDVTTIYELENEVETPAIPEATPPPTDEDPGDSNAAIYDNVSYDKENAAQLNAAEYVMDEIIVKFKEPHQVPGKEEQLQREIKKAEKIGFVESLDLYTIKADALSRDPNRVLNRYKNNRYIDYVEPNYIMTQVYAPNDPSFKTYQAAYTVIDAQAGWDIIKGGSSPIIAVIDTGVAAHPDLPPLISGYSATAGLSYNNDVAGHGTNVAGVIGMIGDNGVGSAGLNWNASIMPIKIDDAYNKITVINVAKGITWAVDNGAKIINLSLSIPGDSLTIRNAINYAYDNGCAIFAASGNNNRDTIAYPARYGNVIAVGATSNGSTRATFSNYGENLNVVALGAFYTTSAKNGYAVVSGTSFACPQAVALASLIWSVNPSLTNAEVYRLIEQGAKLLGDEVNEETGYGLVDFGKTLQLAQETLGSSPIVPTPAPTPGLTPTPTPMPPESPQYVHMPPVITLNGFTELTLAYGQPYQEMGFTAVDDEGTDLTSRVRVESDVDIWSPGLYTVTYTVIDSSGLQARSARTIIVTDPPRVPDLQPPTITLIGSNPTVLEQTGETPYIEQGARATDADGTDLSASVTIAGTVRRDVAGTYMLTYSVTGNNGISAKITREVRIIAPTESPELRPRYGFSGQAKQGGKITHTGIVSEVSGFMDLAVESIDKNMSIVVQLIDTTTMKAVLTDTFTAVGSKQYEINAGKYNLVVVVTKATDNSKYAINLLMPETAEVHLFGVEEQALTLSGPPKITLVGANPIILHQGGTPYTEQGARALDFDGTDISDRVTIGNIPNTDIPGTYSVIYRVVNESGLSAEIVREVHVLAADQ